MQKNFLTREKKKDRPAFREVLLNPFCLIDLSCAWQCGTSFRAAKKKSTVVWCRDLEEPASGVVSARLTTIFLPSIKTPEMNYTTEIL